MIRTLFLCFLLGSLLYASSVDRKIQKTSKELRSFSQNYRRLNKKMAQTAEAILRQKREIQAQQKEIAKLEAELKEKSSSYEISKKQLQTLLKRNSSLAKKADALEQELAFAIAKSVSLSIILGVENSQDIDSIIELEILKAKLKSYKKRIANLNADYIKTLSTIDLLSSQAKSLKRSIESIDKKRKRLLAIQKKNKEDLKKLKLAKASYKRSLKRLLKKQDELKRVLSRLNIIKIDEARRKKEQEERRRAFASKTIKTTNLPKVKQYGKSYASVKTKRYRGKKTIAPLKSYTITKKYGTYKDPIYGIKVFNESISLKPKKKGAKVRNIFNGKVIYADKTAMLDHVVIVEHANGLHTIYANLSKIAPYIKKGKRIKKGYVLGRVNDELVFEATQKSLHINPIELFKR
ncbi:Membrane-bound metallopeptidase [hydrothermal vent metagenome]|uniref:Membrane-bound metallopeptidase n=1 Tax=hydrothermal vent metagenome TaxID=652676 RepID=A0A1W1BEB7_9ZZZZ